MIVKYYDPINEHKHLAYPVLRVNDWLLVLVEGGAVEAYEWRKSHNDTYERDTNYVTIPFYSTPVGLELLKTVYPDLRNYL